MTENLQKFRETTTHAGNTVQKTTEVQDEGAKAAHQQNVAERIIWYVAGVLLAILSFRFVLSLMGANKSNGFANFVYTASHPFVTPFISLFKQNDIVYGISRFEIYTLVAILFYALLAWGIARLVTINRD